MGTKETNILQECRLKASDLGAVLWRNNQGAYKDAKGYYIKYGVCNPGGADLIGLMPVVVTEEMVGQLLGVFVGVEIKAPDGKVTPEQANFMTLVNKNGGIGFIARSKEDMEENLGKKK